MHVQFFFVFYLDLDGRKTFLLRNEKFLSLNDKADKEAENIEAEMKIVCLRNFSFSSCSQEYAESE
jgi:hypothetical protein